MPKKPWQNSSGCNDLTAYTATKPTVEERRVSAFVECVRTLADLCGFEILNWIKIRSKRSGKEY